TTTAAYSRHSVVFSKVTLSAPYTFAVRCSASWTVSPPSSQLIKNGTWTMGGIIGDKDLLLQVWQILETEGPGPDPQPRQMSWLNPDCKVHAFNQFSPQRLMLALKLAESDRS